MCRIAGFVDKNKDKNYDRIAAIENMTDVQKRGGPDWGATQSQKNFYLGHRRLSIIDLDKRSNQPYIYKQWSIIFNGEVYNFNDVKKELLVLGYTFETTSDTEVVIIAFDAWGVDAIQKFRGMFAFALYNSETGKLILCRDRLGIKPLYCYNSNDVFMFASELKAFHSHPLFQKKINKSSVKQFINKGYLNYEHSIFENVFKLSPATYLIIDEKGNIEQSCKYWNLDEISVVNTITEQEALAELDKLMLDSIQLRLIADVKVGLFLSGGIDSSLLLSYLHKLGKTNIDTFTIGFESKYFDESVHAKQIANHLGYVNHNFSFTENQLLQLLPEFAETYDEPFADASALPTMFLSKETRNHVTVALSADGGDELFGGYSRYIFFKKYGGRISEMNSTQKKLLLNLSQVLPASLLFSVFKMFLAKKTTNFESRFKKIQSLLRTNSLNEIYDLLSSTPLTISRQNLFEDTSEYLSVSNSINFKSNNYIDIAGRYDMKTYLEGDILTKVDRASMRFALEAREPFLDHKLAEFAFSLPDNLKFHNGTSKFLLKRQLSNYLPPELFNRPKQGFTVPIEQWLYDKLYNQLKDYIDDSSMMEELGFNKNYLRSLIVSKASVRHHTPILWNIFVLCQWYQKWMK